MIKFIRHIINRSALYISNRYFRKPRTPLQTVDIILDSDDIIDCSNKSIAGLLMQERLKKLSDKDRNKTCTTISSQYTSMDSFDFDVKFNCFIDFFSKETVEACIQNQNSKSEVSRTKLKNIQKAFQQVVMIINIKDYEAPESTCGDLTLTYQIASQKKSLCTSQNKFALFNEQCIDGAIGSGSFLTQDIIISSLHIFKKGLFCKNSQSPDPNFFKHIRFVIWENNKIEFKNEKCHIPSDLVYKPKIHIKDKKETVEVEFPKTFYKKDIEPYFDWIAIKTERSNCIPNNQTLPIEKPLKAYESGSLFTIGHPWGTKPYLNIRGKTIMDSTKRENIFYKTYLGSLNGSSGSPVYFLSDSPDKPLTHVGILSTIQQQDEGANDVGDDIQLSKTNHCCYVLDIHTHQSTTFQHNIANTFTPVTKCETEMIIKKLK
ncbi:MAG: hypothetical protein KDC34_06845 [Saprospiraceae bacterium]|nr:hypothetical protein [Saprospiraceae bacterium]